MSVLVTGRFFGDTDTFEKALADRADEFLSISDRARAAGCVHHRAGLGDGFVVIVDEWDTAAHFEAFFGMPEMQAFIGSIGADATIAPEITVTEALTTPDQF